MQVNLQRQKLQTPTDELVYALDQPIALPVTSTENTSVSLSTEFEESKKLPLIKVHQPYMNRERKQQLINAGYIDGQSTMTDGKQVWRPVVISGNQDFSNFFDASFTQNQFRKQQLKKAQEIYQSSAKMTSKRNLQPLVDLTKLSSQVSLPWTRTKQYLEKNTLTTTKHQTLPDYVMGIFPNQQSSSNKIKGHNQTIKHSHFKTTDLFVETQAFQTIQKPISLKSAKKQASNITAFNNSFNQSHLAEFKTAYEALTATPESAFKSQHKQQNFIQPACFCELKQVCKKHSQEQPTIDSLLELLEQQFDSLSEQEPMLHENLQNIENALHSTVLSVRDQFKEQIGFVYNDKTIQVKEIEQNYTDLLEREGHYQTNIKECAELKSKIDDAYQIVKKQQIELKENSRNVSDEANDLKIKFQLKCLDQVQSEQQLQNLNSEAERLQKKVFLTNLYLNQQKEIASQIKRESKKVQEENLSFKKFYLANNAYTEFDRKSNSPKQVRYENQQVYNDLRATFKNTGSFIHEGLSQIEQIVDEQLSNKNEALGRLIKAQDETARLKEENAKFQPIKFE